jgi:hypothetical protein
MNFIISIVMKDEPVAVRVAGFFFLFGFPGATLLLTIGAEVS